MTSETTMTSGTGYDKREVPQQSSLRTEIRRGGQVVSLLDRIRDDCSAAQEAVQSTMQFGPSSVSIPRQELEAGLLGLQDLLAFGPVTLKDWDTLRIRHKKLAVKFSAMLHACDGAKAFRRWWHEERGQSALRLPVLQKPEAPR